MVCVYVSGQERPELEHLFEQMDLAFTSFFVVELIVNITAHW